LRKTVTDESDQFLPSVGNPRDETGLIDFIQGLKVVGKERA